MMNCVAREPIAGELAVSDVLLVGEANPYFAGHGDSSYSLYCYPIGSAGHRLRQILGLPQHQYLALHRVNLCDGDWSSAAACARARDLLAADQPWRVIVLLGRKVTETFEKIALDNQRLEPFASAPYRHGITFVSLPHPSGRQTVWYQPWAKTRAREILRAIAPAIAWGSTDA